MNRKNASTFLSFAFLIVVIWSAILPVSSLQNNVSISSNGTVNYSESSRTRAVMTKAVWVEPDYQSPLGITDVMLTKFINGKTFTLFIFLGFYQNDLTLNYHYYWKTDNEIAALLATIRAKDSRFKIYAYLGSYDFATPVTKPDITTSGNRATLINAIKSLVGKNFGGYYFDGYHDDMENREGTETDYRDFLNAMTSALRSIGKLSSAALGYWFSNAFWQNLDLDYTEPMLFTGSSLTESTFKTQMNRILLNSRSPVLLGIHYTTTANELDWIIAQLRLKVYDKFAGVSVWCAEKMSTSDWVAWTNWSLN